MSASGETERTAPAQRHCDGCTLSCKLMDVPELDKPALLWCRHCEPSSGCRIYAERPQVCRDFRCVFLLNSDMPEAWRPSRSHLVIAAHESGRLVRVHSDPQWPQAWRAEPYYSYFKRWSANLIERASLLMVVEGARRTAILPDRDVELGALEGRSVILKKHAGPHGFTYDLETVAEDDPRAVHLVDRAAKLSH
jgi:hypothetical protein